MKNATITFCIIYGGVDYWFFYFNIRFLLEKRILWRWLWEILAQGQHLSRLCVIQVGVKIVYENCTNNNTLNNFVLHLYWTKSCPFTFLKVPVFHPHLSQSACVLDIHSLRLYPSTHLKVSPNSFILSERTSKVRALKRIVINFIVKTRMQNTVAGSIVNFDDLALIILSQNNDCDTQM